MEGDGAWAPFSLITDNRCFSHSLHCCCSWLVSVLGPECTQLVNEEPDALRSRSLLRLSKLALLE
jgi:hypothetical protein